jgi:hypothetical protein
MRHLVALAVLTFLAAGCSYPATHYDPHVYDRYDRPPDYETVRYHRDWEYEPLRSEFWFDEHTGRASIRLNHSAYVAMFVLQPLGSIELIYPYSGRNRLVRAGRRTVAARGWDYYHADHRAGSGWAGDYGRNTPAYILMIASERPLDLDRLLRHGGRLPWIERAGAPLDPLRAAEDLAWEIVPGSHDRDRWTLAYQAIWPGADFRVERPIYYTHVRCGGVYVSVPLDAVRIGWYSCPGRHWREPYRRVIVRGPVVERPPQVARPRAPSITRSIDKTARPRDWEGATPTRGSERQLRGEAKPRQPSSPRRARPRTPGSESPTVRPAKPRSQPTARPRSEARPRPTPRAKPEARPRPAPRRKPEARPRPAPRRKPEARPARPAPRRKPEARPRPAPRRKPEARPVRPARKPEARPARPAPKPRPKPKRPAKKKKEGGGG